MTVNILLVGGSSPLTGRLIQKFKKEGHRVCMLTGSRLEEELPERVFEAYRFPYDSDAVQAVFESVAPDVTVFLGAYDPNFRWGRKQKTSVWFASALSNCLTSFDMHGKGRFIYLSSDEVYGGNYPEDVTEETEVHPETEKGRALAQGENMCGFFGKLTGKDVVTLRLQRLYGIPEKRVHCNETLTWMCLEALRGNTLHPDENQKFAILYDSDAIQFIYDIAVCQYHEHALYNLSSSKEIDEVELAQMIHSAMEKEGGAVPVPNRNAEPVRLVLSNKRFVSEFKATVWGNTEKNIGKIAAQMKRARTEFLTDAERKPSLWERIKQRAGWLIKAVTPFVENLLCFIPAFLLSNYTAGGGYFSRLDIFLLYVLLFAIVHGQQQAVFSGVLATLGYFIQQSGMRGGFEVAIDYNTYVWIAQIFIVGLVVGYQHDQIQYLKDEAADEQEYLSEQLGDVRSINESNVRVKDALTTQIINQNDSIGRIYHMTSGLDRLMPEEVLFRAASMLGELMDSRDVAIYTVSGGAYARLFSSTSLMARRGGSSIRYMDYGEMSEALQNRKVYINRKLDEKYPMMASAIYDGGEIQTIIMVWSLPWDHMTLGQADHLTVCGYLIQNAVVHANRYLSFQRSERYLEGMQILNQDSFRALADSFMNAKKDGLTECTLLSVEMGQKTLAEAEKELMGGMRNSDYIGVGKAGELCVLLSNTGKEAAEIVRSRFEGKGYPCQMRERLEL